MAQYRYEDLKRVKRIKSIVRGVRLRMRKGRDRLTEEILDKMDQQLTLLEQAVDSGDLKKAEDRALRLAEVCDKYLPGVKAKSTIREYAEAIIIAVLLALFIRGFIIQAFKIPSGSMEPTLLVGDHILVNKFIYGIKIPFVAKKVLPITEPKRGDIIVFIYPMDESKDFIKRVIGVGGDTIQVVDKTVYVNGEPIREPYAYYEDGTGAPPIRENFGPITVPKESVFVMGDNRDKSYDSRFWSIPFVNKNKIKGKAMIIYWSWNREDFNIRWSRIGRLVR